MDIAELQRRTTSEGIRSDAFSLEGGLPSEQYVLDPSKPGRWTVYYSERGMRSREREFTSESEAVEYLFELVRSDPATR